MSTACLKIRKTVSTSAAIILFALLLSCGDGLPPEFPGPDFELKGPLSEKTVTQDAIKGKPAIVYWFTSW
jgi:hypothetical protein